MGKHNINPECHLWGECFYPSRLILENIRSASDPGDIGGIGKYKGLPKPYGTCCITTPEEIAQPDRILWMADFIYKKRKAFIDAGATEIVFWIYWEGIQGNMEFTPNQLKKLAKLEIPLCIDYIQVEGDECDIA